MDSAQNKTGSRSRKKPGGFRRDNREARETRETKEKPQGEKANSEKPAAFNAHALDMEEGFVMPVRPTVDLTYVDFTREAVTQSERRPFVPKRRNEVPFEMSETPKSQSENRDRDARQPERRPRKQAERDIATEQKAEVNAIIEKAPEPAKDKSIKKSKREEGKTDQVAQRHKIATGKETRAKASESGESRKPQGRVLQAREATSREKPNHREAVRGAQREALERESATQENTKRDEGAEKPVRESLMRPYWLKK